MGHNKANSAYSDQTAHNVVYDKDLQFTCIMFYENLEKIIHAKQHPFNGKWARPNEMGGQFH